MAKDLYQNTERSEKTYSDKRRLWNKERVSRIIGIATLGLLLTACGASAGGANEKPGGLEDSEILQGTEANEEQKEWPEEQYSCEVQELSGYLYEHTSVSASPYASAEITIKDYEGEQLETDWDEPRTDPLVPSAQGYGRRSRYPGTGRGSEFRRLDRESIQNS